MGERCLSSFRQAKTIASKRSDSIQLMFTLLMLAYKNTQISSDFSCIEYLVGEQCLYSSQ